MGVGHVKRTQLLVAILQVQFRKLGTQVKQPAHGLKSGGVADLVQRPRYSDTRARLGGKENISWESECWEKEGVFNAGLIFFLAAYLLSQGLEV